MKIMIDDYYSGFKYIRMKQSFNIIIMIEINHG